MARRCICFPAFSVLSLQQLILMDSFPTHNVILGNWVKIYGRVLQPVLYYQCSQCWPFLQRCEIASSHLATFDFLLLLQQDKTQSKVMSQGSWNGGDDLCLHKHIPSIQLVTHSPKTQHRIKVKHFETQLNTLKDWEKDSTVIQTMRKMFTVILSRMWDIYLQALGYQPNINC